jgi:hypothetical protein
VLAGHAVERLGVAPDGDPRDAADLDAGVGGRLTQHVAVGAGRFHRQHQRATGFEFQELAGHQAHLARQSHTPGAVEGLVRPVEAQDRLELGHVDPDMTRLPGPRLHHRFDRDGLDAHDAIR